MKARANPFRTDRVHNLRYRLQQGTWAELIERLIALNYRAALVGPEGSGKTTLLEDIEAKLQARGLAVKNLRLDRETQSFPPGFLGKFLAHLTAGNVILFDGADLMSRPTWFWFRWRTKKAAGLVITSHRRGLLPTLIECRTTPALLDEIVAQLLGDESAGLRDTTRQLYIKHHGNLRHALRELYDIYAAKVV